LFSSSWNLCSLVLLNPAREVRRFVPLLAILITYTFLFIMFADLPPPAPRFAWLREAAPDFTAVVFREPQPLLALFLCVSILSLYFLFLAVFISHFTSSPGYWSVRVAPIACFRSRECLLILFLRASVRFYCRSPLFLLVRLRTILLQGRIHGGFLSVLIAAWVVLAGMASKCLTRAIYLADFFRR